MFVMTSLCAKHKTDVSVFKMSLKKSLKKLYFQFNQPAHPFKKSRTT